MRSLSILSLRGSSLSSLLSIQIELLHITPVDWHGYWGRHYGGMMVPHVYWMTLLTILLLRGLFFTLLRCIQSEIFLYDLEG